MNKTFKVVFNHSTGTFQAVSETAKGKHKTTSSQKNNKAVSVLKAMVRPVVMMMGVLSSAVAVAMPTGGQVSVGQATINQAGNITNINQSSQNAAINWQSFNIAHNETVNFNQPNAQSVTLNRVIGNEKSVIDGAMNANGKVFISNANGMLIGKDAKINVGSLVATTANISDDDVMNGRYSFTGGQGSIENLGQISVPKGGMVALVAPIVKNGGTITAHEGNVLLASAESFSITLPDNANFAYTLDKGTLQGLVDNGGAILADAGRVVLTAKGVDTVKKSLIKHSGNIEANTVQNKNGVIELLGDLDNSALNVSGSLKAEGKGDDKGGFIETSSAQLNFDDNAVISTKSESGQTGTWLISTKEFTISETGGDMTGQQVTNALRLNNVTLKSSSIERDLEKLRKPLKEEIEHLRNLLNDLERKIELLELDIQNAYTKEKQSLLENYERSAEKYVADLAEKEKLYRLTQPDLMAYFDMRNQQEKKGAIIINDEISWDKNTLTLNAENDIYINKTLNGSGTAKLALEYGQGVNDSHHGDFHIKKGGKVNLPTGKALSTKVGNEGEKTDFEVIHEMPKIVKNTNGEWDSTFTTRNIAFGKDIDVGFTKNYEGFAGWQSPLIEHNNSIAGGIIYGLGHSVSNVHINTKSNQSGFMTELNSGAIRDLTFNNINIFGQNNVGGVIGKGDGNYLKNITINNANIKGDENVGGIIGIATGAATSIHNISINGNVVGNMSVGGIVGYYSNATVNSSQVLANVTGNSEVGGIIGTSVSSSIYDSYVTGSIKEGQKPNRPKNIYLGGLVGSVDSQNGSGATFIQNSYFSGKIDTTENSDAVGAIVGGNVSPNVELHTNNVFFNVDKSKLDEGGAVLGKEHGIAKTESELKQKSTFAGWDETIWNIQDGKLPTLRHTENTVTSPTVPPVTPPINNVDFEPAKKSLADTKLYRQNMLNRMVIFAKNGEFAKLNIDQINDNIRKEIAKTQALIDVLPDGAEKTNLQNQLNAITVLTRDEIQNAEKVSNDVATEKQKEQQRKEQAEKDKKDAYDAVSNLEKSRQAILDNYYNQAKQGKLLDSSNINQTLSQAWLNAKNKVNKVTEQSEQTNLNNRLSVLGVLTQAEIDRAKAFVKAYQDNQARLEEEKKRAEEARRKAEEEKRKAEQQAKEQERIQALFKDAQNLVQQAKEFAERSQSLVDNGRTNDVATLNKNLTERKQQAQASIDKLPNNATKTLLQRQLNEIALVKANGGVNNPQVKPVEKPNAEHEKTDKERKHILQINHDVVTEQVNKKPEKPIPVIDTNAIAIKECNLNKNCATAQDIKNTKLGKIPDVWKNGILSEDNNLEDLKKAQIVLDKQSLYGEGTKIVEDLFDLRNHLNNVSHEVSMYTHGIDDSVKLRKGKESISIKDYIDAQIEQNLLNNKLKKLDENQRFLDGKFDEVIAQDPEKTKLLDDSIKNRNKAFEGVEKIRNQARQEKSNKANLFWDIFWKEVYKVGDALSVGVSGFKAMTSSVTAPLKNAGEKLTHAQNLIKTTTETADNRMKIINVAKSITDVFVSINDPNVSNAESWQVAAYATSDLIQMLQDDNLTTFLGGVTNVSQMLDSARTMHSYATSMQSISQIPDELLHPDDKKILIRVYQDKMYKEYKKTAQSMTSIFGSITGTSGYTDALNNSIDAIDGALDVFKNDEYTRLAEKMIDIKNDVDKTRSAYHEGIKHHAGITLNKLLIIGETAEVVKPKETSK